MIFNLRPVLFPKPKSAKEFLQNLNMEIFLHCRLCSPPPPPPGIYSDQRTYIKRQKICEGKYIFAPRLPLPLLAYNVIRLPSAPLQLLSGLVSHCCCTTLRASLHQIIFHCTALRGAKLQCSGIQQSKWIGEPLLLHHSPRFIAQHYSAQQQQCAFLL